MVDLCFVFDTTGSMDNKIDALVACMVDFVTQLSDLWLDWRISVVPFGDLTVPGDRIVDDLPFVTSQSVAESMLRAMPRFSGGGNTGESSIEALESALGKPYRPEAVTMLILITDEPALFGQRSDSVVLQMLLDANAILFTVTGDEPYYRRWAEATGGMWREINLTLDAADIIALLRQIAGRVATVAYEVHALAQGSVETYRSLNRGEGT
jgi:hypothetical protein